MNLDPHAYNMDDILSEVMQGAVDSHVHFGPDVAPTPTSLFVARRYDALETAQAAEAAGMAAISLKSHWWPTGALCRQIQKLVPGVKVLGMTVINYHCGGFNPFYVDMSARLGCKVLMAPTIHTKEAIQNRRANGQPDPYGVRPDQEGLSLVDDKGQMVPEMEEILDIAQEYDMLVTSGHVHAPEDKVLVERSHARGLRCLLTHLRPDKDLLADRQEMAQKGAIIEWGWNELWPLPDPIQMVEEARAIGIESCGMTVDGGQAIKPSPAESFREFAGRLIVSGMHPSEVKIMASKAQTEALKLDQIKDPLDPTDMKGRTTSPETARG